MKKEITKTYKYRLYPNKYQIEMFDKRWEEMIGKVNEDTVSILKEVSAKLKSRFKENHDKWLKEMYDYCING